MGDLDHLTDEQLEVYNTMRLKGFGHLTSLKAAENEDTTFDLDIRDEGGTYHRVKLSADQFERLHALSNEQRIEFGKMLVQQIKAKQKEI